MTKLTYNIKPHACTLPLPSPGSPRKSSFCYAPQFMWQNSGAIIFKAKAVLSQLYVNLTIRTVFCTINQKLLKNKNKKL